MKVRELIEILREVDGDEEIEISVNGKETNIEGVSVRTNCYAGHGAFEDSIVIEKFDSIMIVGK